jgi:hypothetical protein
VNLTVLRIALVTGIVGSPTAQTSESEDKSGTPMNFLVEKIEKAHIKVFNAVKCKDLKLNTNAVYTPSFWQRAAALLRDIRDDLERMNEVSDVIPKLARRQKTR